MSRRNQILRWVVLLGFFADAVYARWYHIGRPDYSVLLIILGVVLFIGSDRRVRQR